ncbi:MAG TPA: L,D-transpeptidase family protein, partial [Rubricoccaceae bacterium]|nr:L,D-transpeptidase family protein [Rubricoccaceae bacterium]
MRSRRGPLLALTLGGSGACLALVAVALVLWPAAGPSPSAEPAEPELRLEPVAPVLIRARFSLDGDSVTVGTAAMPAHPALAAFYAGRAYAQAWTDPAARDVVLERLRGAADDGLRPEDYHTADLDRLLAGPHDADSVRVDLDLLLTEGVLRYADALLGRRVAPDSLYRGVWFPARRTADVGGLLRAALAAAAPADSLAAVLDGLHPPHPEYAALRALLARHRTLAARPDWPTVLPGEPLRPGERSARVPALRERLTLTGDYLPVVPVDSAFANLYDEALAAAVRSFQEEHGLTADGVVEQTTRAALNTRPEDLSPLLALNLERWRWLPDDLGARHVLVNLPTYELAVRDRSGEGWAEAVRMGVVIGRRYGWKTPVFSDTLSMVVFNPTWSIPASIQREMGYRRPRLMVRGPGPWNPLGRVKFVFPNPYGIYFHDTTA